MCAAQGAMEAALAEEVHESQQVPGAERNHSVRRQPRNGHLSRKRSADEPCIVQGVHHAAEEPVHEHGVRPVVARRLGTLDHHEHDGDAVRRVQDGREPTGVDVAQKREQHESGDDHRKHDAEQRNYVEPHALELPQHHERDGGNQRCAHRQRVHQRSDGRIVDGQRADEPRAQPE